MRAPQGKARARFMVKGRGLPTRLVMACRAFGYNVAFGELAAVSVFVAAIAGGGGSLKNNLPIRRQGGRLMALRASHRPVSAAQSKRGSRVVESSHLFPRTHGVANVAVVF